MPRLTGARCQCAACGEPFNSVSVFDRHRRGTRSDESPHRGRRCLTTEEMTGRGWRRNAAGFWIARQRLVPVATPSAGAEIAPSLLDDSGSDRSPLRSALTRDLADERSGSVPRAA